MHKEDTQEEERNMDRKVTIVVDSTCDIDVNVAKELGIRYMPILIDINGQSYKDGYEITAKEFYKKISDKDTQAKTSLVSPLEFEEIFKEELAKGMDVVCLTISSSLSGTHNSAMLAKNMLESDKISVIDSKTVSLGFELLTLEAAKLANEGLSGKEIVEKIESLKEKQRLLVYVETLEMLKRGGRIPKSLAAIGGVLRIKPILAMEDGILDTVNKTRSKKAGFKFLVEKLNEMEINKDYPFVVAHADNLEGANELMEEIKDKIKDAKVIVSEIGPAVGTHVGQGAVAMAFIEK